MEIELLFRNGEGEDSPFKVDVSDSLCDRYNKLDAKIVVEANLRMATMYFNWKEPVIMLHVPLPAVSVAVEKMVELGSHMKLTDIVIPPPPETTRKRKRVKK